MTQYSIVSENDESTVVTSYEIKHSDESQYQSETALEKAFIEQLQAQAYEYLPIHCEDDLIRNLRKQLEKLNNITFSDDEWQRFFTEKIANKNFDIAQKSFIVQEDNVQLLDRDDGTVKNVTLIDKDDIHNNSLQVINQYVEEKGNHDNRYDVTILVNGLPLVHVELKRRGVSLKEAFNQIIRYNRDSFWAGSGLYEYIQIFVISNGTETKYYSNTTRDAHIREVAENSGKPRKQTSNSYEFTSYWADANNKIIPDLMDFTKTFFSKHTILRILTHYCIYTSEKLLLVMRPYQIVATERILNQIKSAFYRHKYGTIDGGGYVWHTTGSGKTLTSFKTARLASQMDFIDKVLFVVDRKDLDYQTMKEYDRFEKGAANSNTSTAVLRRQLLDKNAKIIITTIQKLSSLIKKNQDFPAYMQHVVFIFDECHRSQFGDMHKAITKKFKKYYLFGFTGTPIFAQNAGSNGLPDLKTTDQAFGKRLHTYTIVNAIADGNVLPFRVEYIKTIKEKQHVKDGDKEVWGIEKQEALQDPKRIHLVTKYILEHFSQKCKRNDKSYEFRQLANVEEVAKAQKNNKDAQEIKEVKVATRLTGFNSIFAVSNIPMAKLYYTEFTKLQKDLPEAQRLKVATIYSYGVNGDDNEDASGLPDDENSEDTSGLSVVDRDFLEAAIQDYNSMFHTNYDTSSDKFQNYYKDVSLRMKNRQIDVLIVVNMFLTGFDATTLNTLWVDKDLKMHGLIQAYSRTNRILNSIKTFGNIVCFRNLEDATNEAIALFGDKDAAGIVLMRTYDEYYHGYADEKGEEQPGYDALVDDLLTHYPIGEQIISEEQQKRFIKLWGAILKLRNILTAFDQFSEDNLLTERAVQDYCSVYNTLHEKWRTKQHEKEGINDDVEFEMELIKQIEVNIDYILALVKKYHEEHTQNGRIEIRTDIDRAIGSSPRMRNKKDLIDDFIKSLTPASDVDDDWNAFIHDRMKSELDDIITTEKLKPEQARKFVNGCFHEGYVETSGTAVADILPPMGRFSKGGVREKKKQTVIDKIKAFFDRFFDLCPEGVDSGNTMNLPKYYSQDLPDRIAADPEVYYGK